MQIKHEAMLLHSAKAPSYSPSDVYNRLTCSAVNKYITQGTDRIRYPILFVTRSLVKNTRCVLSVVTPS